MPNQQLPLPQQGPARLVTEILDHTETEVTCRAEIPCESPFRPQAGKRAPAYLVIEMAAQTAAVLISQAKRAAQAHEAVPAGYIAAVRDLVLPHDGLDTETQHVIRASLVTASTPLFIVSFTASCNQTTIASGTLTIASA